MPDDRKTLETAVLRCVPTRTSTTSKWTNAKLLKMEQNKNISKAWAPKPKSLPAITIWQESSESFLLTFHPASKSPVVLHIPFSQQLCLMQHLYSWHRHLASILSFHFLPAYPLMGSLLHSFHYPVGFMYYLGLRGAFDFNLYEYSSIPLFLLCQASCMYTVKKIPGRTTEILHLVGFLSCMQPPQVQSPAPLYSPLKTNKTKLWEEPETENEI